MARKIINIKTLPIRNKANLYAKTNYPSVMYTKLNVGFVGESVDTDRVFIGGGTSLVLNAVFIQVHKNDLPWLIEQLQENLHLFNISKDGD